MVVPTRIENRWIINDKIYTAGLQKSVRNLQSSWKVSVNDKFDIIKIVISPPQNSDCLTFDSEVLFYNSSNIIIPYKEDYLIKIKNLTSGYKSFQYRTFKEIVAASKDWNILIAWGLNPSQIVEFRSQCQEVRCNVSEVKDLCGRPTRCPSCLVEPNA